MRHGSLFSGIGGFDLAAEWMGWENVFHCEWNPFGQKVLKHYWPHSISYNDITKTDFYIHRGDIDIITGGFPCQPYSSAGKRLGKEDERHLWPEMLRCIREVSPSWIVGENVRGLTNWNGGMVFDEVQADLEAIGYEVTPFLLPACAVNAPHRRDRIWFIAYRNAANAMPIRLQQCENGTEMGGGQSEVCEAGSESANGIETNGKIPNATDSESFDIQNKWHEQNSLGEKDKRQSATGFKYGNIQTNWTTFPTSQPTICNGDDGLSNRLDGITFPKWRNESIKAGGNAVVPQVVYQIFKAIESFNSQNPKP
jgi:DNA (cytosine-5)-methyltransferase 1